MRMGSERKEDNNVRTKEEILEELDRIRRQKREAIKAQIRCVGKMMKLQEELKEVEEHGANLSEERGLC